MPDLLLDALPVIDLLEITANTSAVAQLTQRDQSSVSRIYRQASNRLGLQFTKAPSGDYHARDNQALLQHLRCSSQQLRLHNPIDLRWLGCPWTPALISGTRAPQALPNRWTSTRRICDLVRDHLLDLAIVPGLELLPSDHAALTAPEPLPLACDQLVALPLVHYPMRIAADLQHPLHGHSSLEIGEITTWPVLAPEGDPAPRRDRWLRDKGLQVSAPNSPWALPPLSLMADLALANPSEPERLQALPIVTDLADLDLVVMRRELSTEPAVLDLLQAIETAYQRAFQRRPDLRWLR